MDLTEIGGCTYNSVSLICVPVTMLVKGNILCRERAIPQDYHAFYDALKCNADGTDTLPEADVEEDKVDIVE